MKDINIPFNPAGFFVIDPNDYQNLKNTLVITQVNNETIKVDLRNLDERVYSPNQEVIKLDAQIAEATKLRNEAVAISDAVGAIQISPDITPEPSPVEITTP